jgi:hypothetical protein
MRTHPLPRRAEGGQEARHHEKNANQAAPVHQAY